MFLFVGRMMKYKGLPLILDAVKMLSESGTDYRMVFIGSGKDADEMKATVKEYGITLYEKTEQGTERTDGSLPDGAVIFTGPVYDRNELRAWNTRADLFLFPSTYDTNGTHSGLPAGPICNPGTDAIEAALNPDDTNYYYFCHNNKGKIYLAKTYDEFQRNWTQVLKDNEESTDE